jgi:hypothetical protein
LAELDEGWPELVKELTEMTASLRGKLLDAGLPVPGQEIVQPVSVEEVPEAVPHGDLRDLGDAP